MKLIIPVFFFALLLFSAGCRDHNMKSENIPAAQTGTSVDTAGKQVTSSLGQTIKEEILNPPQIQNILSFGKIFWSIVFLVIGYFVIRIITRALDLLAERKAGYRLSLKGYIPVIKILGWIVIIVIIISGIIQPPAATLIAVSASLGVAVGFAAQDILKNIFGGIMIILDRPYQVGDKVEIGNYYGEIVEIGLRSTRLVTPDDSRVTVPNGEVMSHAVSNANAGEPNCQVVAEIYLPVAIDTGKVRQIALETAQTSKYVFLNKPIVVLFFNELKEKKPYLKMRLKAYVLDIRYEFQFKSDMTEIVLRELYNQGILSHSDSSLF